MYKALGLRSVIESQVYKALSKPPVECYDVQDLFISRTSCDVKSYGNDDRHYVRLKIDSFRPYTEFLMYYKSGYRKVSWEYIRLYVKNEELLNSELLKKMHFNRLAAALLNLTDDPVLGCWHYLIKNATKVHIPETVRQLVAA